MSETIFKRQQQIQMSFSVKYARKFCMSQESVQIAENYFASIVRTNGFNKTTAAQIVGKI